MKKLSIITICYNEPNLEKTCESIVNQTWQDFEWIVIDGGSNKTTLDIFEKYKYRIDKFVSEPDNGIYDAVNKGISLATSEWVNILNAGDCYHSKDVLEKIYIKDRQADILYGEQYSVYTNPKKSNVIKFPQELTTEFFINSNIATPAVFIKRYLFDEFGGFSEQYKIVSDYEKWIIYFKNGKTFEYLDFIIADFDKTGISSNKKYKKLRRKELKEVQNKYFSSKEIELAQKQYNNFSILEQIFSVKNSGNPKYKVITILGIHIKIRRKANA